MTTKNKESGMLPMDLPPDVERIVREAYREAAEEEMERIEDDGCDPYEDKDHFREATKMVTDMRGQIPVADIDEEAFDYWKNWENRR